MGSSEVGAVVAASPHYILNACPILQLLRAAARPGSNTTDMTRAIVIALLLTVAPTAWGQTLADLWDGRAKWDLAAEKVGGDFTFHCLSILPQDGKLLGYYIANYTTADGRHRMGIGRAQRRWNELDR